jgi:hypothetical protein
MSLAQFVERAAEITGAYGNYRTVPERVNPETVAAAQCELAAQEIELFIHFCYQQSDTPYFINLTGGSQIPTGIWTPWGSSGKSHLRRLERDIVRAWLLSLKKHRGARPLFYYLPEERRWYVDTFRYRILQDALQWLKTYKLTPKTWLTLRHNLLERNRQGNKQRNR